MTALDFDAQTAWTAVGPGRWRGSVDPSWMQGRATFGGLMAGIAVRAMRSAVAEDRPLRALDVAFVGPLGPGEAELRSRLLREGSSVSQLEAELVQDGQTCARFLGVFGKPRAARIRVEAGPMRASAPASEAPIVPRMPGAPVFLDHFELRWTEGGAPFSGVDTTVVGGHLRHRTRASGEAALVALVDVFPAPVLPMTRGPTPASSVRWTTHVFGPLPEDPEALCFFRYETVRAVDGYVSAVGTLHGPDGRALAWSEQLMMVFER
jgi:acyl-CoA thioesterase